ncbi:uncharacterized protein [Dermacentor albipictus]|uniref:uncharacterized protein isoform X2 n=1 Tax=Dermacentor albipictus TaxID=60249 RepID=UPI0031FCE489
MYYARLNVTSSVVFARRLLCRLSAGALRTSYCRTLSQAKGLIEDDKAGSSSLSYKDYVLEPAGVHRDEFKKRFHACRSVDEVLHLVFAGEDSKPKKPQDLVASAEALVRIQYRILSSFQWAYRDIKVTMRVQAAANSDTVDMFLSLHHHPSFAVLLDEIEKNMECFTSEEAVHLLDALLKLCVPKYHDVLVKLQERCIVEREAFDLVGLVRLAEASNFLKRNGFVLSGLVCSLVQRTFDTIPFTFGSTRSKECALEAMERIKTQLSPLQFFFFFYNQSFQDEFSYEHDLPHVWYKSVLERHQEIPNIHIASNLMMKFFPTGGSRQQRWRISKADARLWADILEASTPVLNNSTFRQVLKCILGHQLYVPATLEVLCESALKKSLKVHLAMKLTAACAKVNYRPQCLEELGNLYANHLVEIAEMDELHVVDVLRFSHSLLHLDCFAERLVRKIFSISYLQKVDSFVNECPEMKDDVDQMLFECNRCVELQCPELDVPWLWSAPPSAIERSSRGPKCDKLFSMVEDVLRDLAGEDGLVRPKTQSPYFHHIDFECYAGKEFGFISQHDFKANPCLPVRRLAIMLLGDEDYCSNENHLLGPIATKLRQLEILGYTVIKVPCNEFSSIGMDFEAQREYLQEKIFSA